LRQIAILVARESSPDQLFAAVAEQVAGVVGVPHVRLVRYEPQGSVVVGGFSEDDDELFPIGSHWPLDSPGVTASVRQTGRPARVEDYGPMTGDIAAVARGAGMRAAVASPIVVGRRLWGAMVALSPLHEPFPEDTESRLTDFTELLATAIANAESRGALARLADQQAALRRIAMIAARDSSPVEVFGVVTEEAARVLDTEAVGMLRFEPGGTARLVAQSHTPWDPPPLGTTFTLDGENLIATVHRTGEAARMDDWSTATGAVAAMGHVLGVRSAVAVPIIVERSVWGTMIAATSQSEPMPEDTESRISEFTELVATAISNADGRAALGVIADEQAALRRVATLVARESAPEEMFAAVAEEMGRLLGATSTTLWRFEDDETATLAGRWGALHDLAPVGAHFAVGGENVASEVFRTGRPARMDDYAGASGAIGTTFRSLGVRSAVSVPITVDGRLWGAMGAAATERLPPESESRMEKFSELIATALANIEAHRALARLAEEQAALRRVATLVADQASQEEILGAIAAEIGPLIGIEETRLVRFDDDRSAVTVASSGGSLEFPVGERIPADPGSGTPVARVLQTGESVRVNEKAFGDGPVAATLRRMGVRSGVCAPIYVEGRLWGSINTGSRQEELPPEAESRLAQFTDLLATAIANTESRAKVARLAEEQAALRRVATLVAEDPESGDLISAVAREVAGVMDVRGVIVERFEADGSHVIVGSAYDPELAGADAFLGVGVRLPLLPGTLAVQVFETHRGARVEDYSRLEGLMGDAARAVGIGTGCAAPIVVDGKLWGQMCVYSRKGTVLPASTERQLDDFVKLVATAISNYDAHASLRMLADEQAALRRVATLVARGEAPSVIFAAVSQEVERLFMMDEITDVTTVVRFDAGPEFVVVGAAKAFEGLKIGSRWGPNELHVSTKVFHTGRSARVEERDWSSTGGADAERRKRLGLLSQVGSPIIVEGRVWGAISMDAKSTLPPDTEERLERFTELVATAIANAEGSAELAASRRRIVAASDDTRRRIERDLHDGVQQQLVSLGLELGTMKADPPTGDALAEQLASLTEDVGSVFDALVEIARGIHPAILSQGGLAAALRALARRSAVPVELQARIESPLADEVEVAAYYVVAEALTNAAKHARASVVHMDVTTDDGTLTLIVRDDGVGGAIPGEGSGLVGLRDRVEALGGTIKLDSAAGSGTCVVVTLPIATEPDQEVAGLLYPLQRRGHP
jgi:GAF domain-containing protein